MPSVSRTGATRLFSLCSQRSGTTRIGKAEPPGQIQHLDVEAEAVDALAAEDGPRRVGAERLEAALRVLDAGHGQRLDDAVEDAAHEVPVARLADAPRAAAPRASR